MNSQSKQNIQQRSISSVTFAEPKQVKSSPVKEAQRKFPNAQYFVQQNCVGAQPLCMNIIVVSKEEIEAPWRLECQYLQSLVEELQRKQTTTVVEKVVDTASQSRIELLELQLREAKSQNDNLQSQINKQKYYYEDELSRINGTIELRSAQVEDNQYKEKEFYEIRMKLEDEIFTLQSKIRQLESQLKIYSDENFKYQSIISAKDGEINSLRIQISSSTMNNDQIYRIRELETQCELFCQEISQMETQLTNVNNENDQLQKQLSNWEYQFEQRNDQLVYKLREYETKIALLSAEIQRLVENIKLKENELAIWKDKYEQLEMSGSFVFQEKVNYLSQEVEVWKQKFIKSHHEYNRSQEEITMLTAELESLKKQRKQADISISSRVYSKSSATKQYQ